MVGMSFCTRGPGEWVRGPARIVGDEIVLDDGRAERYTLRESKELPLDLAMLNVGKPEDIKAFVRRHGMLWHGPDELDQAPRDMRESVRDWARTAAELGNTINFYIDLRAAERDMSWTPLRNSASPLFALTFRGILAEFEQPTWTYEDYVGAASKLLAAWLDAKLQKSNLGVVAASEEGIQRHGGQLLLGYYPSDLEIAAYTELAMLIINQQELKMCQGCDRWFAPKSGKQRYHDPSCSTNRRQKRHRQKRSGGETG